MDLDPRVEAALRDAAAKAHVIDADVVTLPVFADLVTNIATEDDAAKAVEQMRQRKPDLFRPWESLTPDEFAVRETAFRRGLVQSRPVGPTIPNGVDYSALSPDEFERADAYLSGRTNDDSVLRRHARDGKAS